MRKLVGVDAGGTRTTAALSVDGNVMRTCEGGPGNPNVAGIELALREIAHSIEAVLGADAADAIVVGAAGTGNAKVRDEMETRLQQRFQSSSVTVCSDAQIALRAAIPHGDGIVAVAGTGSIVYAEAAGKALRSGGDGYAAGDPGSGYAIGLAWLRDPEGMSVAQIASHALVAINAAQAGDARAAAIHETAANELLRMIEDVASRCPARTPLAFAGGLLRERNALTQQLERRIAESALTVRVLAERVEPYHGALHMAARGVTA